MTNHSKRLLAGYMAVSSLTLTAAAAAVSTKDKNVLTALLAAAAAEGMAGAALLYTTSRDETKRRKERKHRIRRFLDVSSLFNDNDYRGFTITDESGRMHECTLYELKIKAENES